MNIPSIETRYGGYVFRSRLEARWVVFFECLDIKFWYEPEGFRLVAGTYLPDFFLPQVRLWAEVKPGELLPMEYAKCEELCLRSEKNVLLLIGPPDFRTYPVIFVTPDGFPTSTDALLDIDFHSREYYTLEHRFFCSTGGSFKSEVDFTPEYREAVYASRAARFDREEGL